MAIRLLLSLNALIMDWKPLSETSLRGKISAAESRMNPEQARLWSLIRIPPQKWIQTPYGAEGGGFWVVAILGSFVVWYNDIEEGFNCSSYSQFGTINEYWCNQDELEYTIQNLYASINTSNPSFQRIASGDR